MFDKKIIKDIQVHCDVETSLGVFSFIHIIFLYNISKENIHSFVFLLECHHISNS